VDPDYLVSSVLALCCLNYFAEASSHIAILLSSKSVWRW
jgi:hypothetical protein